MRNRGWSRRDVLKTPTALAAGALFGRPARAAAPPPTSVTPALIEAARKEGKALVLLRAGAERRGTARQGRSKPNIPASPSGSSAPAPSGFSSASPRSRRGGINAVDVANSTDPAHYLDWKAKDCGLRLTCPRDVAKGTYPVDHVDPDGLYATSCGWIEAIGL